MTEEKSWVLTDAGEGIWLETFELAPADLGTCGGARVNGRAQVLDPFAQPIPGLYASGNNAGVGSPGTSYGGGGGTIGPAMAFAYLAGQSLVEAGDV